MRAWLLLFSLLPGLALAEACIVRSQAERLDVKVCQENRNIPSSLFHEGFCQPQLKGQKVEVEEKYVPFFKTGKEMRERLNDGVDHGEDD